MKKILFISLFCAVQALFISCTADDDTNQATSVSVEETGGQVGIPPPPPPINP